MRPDVPPEISKALHLLEVSENAVHIDKKVVCLMQGLDSLSHLVADNPGHEKLIGNVTTAHIRHFLTNFQKERPDIDPDHWTILVFMLLSPAYKHTTKRVVEQNTVARNGLLALLESWSPSPRSRLETLIDQI